MGRKKPGGVGGRVQAGPSVLARRVALHNTHYLVFVLDFVRA